MWKTLWIMWKTIRNPPKIKDLRKPKTGKNDAKKIPKSDKTDKNGKAMKRIAVWVIYEKKVKKGNEKAKLYTADT